MLSGNSIEHRCRHQGAVIRVHDSSSVSPLRDGGFYAGADQFQGLSNRQWTIQHQHLYYRDAIKALPETLTGITGHVKGGWGWTNESDSDWISTTSDFRWAIWEVARRLARLQKESVETTLARGMKSWKTYRGLKAIGLRASDILEDPTALSLARSSSEVVWYGRIFKKDIFQTDIWTKKCPGVALPEHYFKPRKHRSGDCWLNWLVWDPYSDVQYYEAAEKIGARREQLARSRMRVRA